jgi:hypothetical protein
MARRCPRSKALGLARLERHRLAVMREGWLTAVRASSLRRPWRAVGLGPVGHPGARPPREPVPEPLRQAHSSGHRRARAETGDCLYRRQFRAWRSASGLHCGGSGRGAVMAASGGRRRGAGATREAVGPRFGLARECSAFAQVYARELIRRLTCAFVGWRCPAFNQGCHSNPERPTTTGTCVMGHLKQGWAKPISLA